MDKLAIANNLFEAIDTIIDKKINDLNFDRCVIGHIVNIPNNDNPDYIVKYQDITFIAQPIYPNMELNIDQMVYILVPNNDFAKQKFILG